MPLPAASDTILAPRQRLKKDDVAAFTTSFNVMASEPACRTRLNQVTGLDTIFNTRRYNRHHV